MVSLSLPVSAALTRDAGREVRTAGVVVCSRGDTASDGAVRLAMAMAAERDCAVQLVGIVEPAPMVVPTPESLVAIPDDTDARRDVLVRAIDAQLERLGLIGRGRGRGVGPSLETVIRVGDPATQIVRLARETDARLVVLGATHHHLLDRLFGSDTAVRVARSADVPVLVVPPGCTTLPESAVMAIDFSDDSMRAARAALSLFPDLGSVHLVHVAPAVEPSVEMVARIGGNYMESAEHAFDHVREVMRLPESVAVTRQIVRGNPARELLRVAEERAVDLIVAGSHGRGALQRLLVGSVATALLRASAIPVLVLPLRAAVRDGMTQRYEDAQAWPGVLDAFSARNDGRRATVEVDDPELGAQAQEVDYPFLGCVFDPFDRRLAVMLGDMRVGGRHLVRGMVGVSEIDILRDEQGRDAALRISHGRRGGQTLVVFAS